MFFPHRRRRHLERGELLDEALHALGLGAFVHAVQARRRRARRAAARPLRWRRSSGARSGGGTRSARARAPPRRVPSSSKTNSGSEESSVSAPLCPCGDPRSSAAAAVARGRQRLGPGRARRARARRRSVDLLVAQALVRADQRAVEGGLRDRRPVQLELDRHRRALLPRHERAGVVRERLRQHRLDRARHVHARAAAPGLQIDERALGHIGADVGDVNPHARPRLLRGPSGLGSCVPRRSAEIASSKSRALAGSIVNVGRPVRSRLPSVAWIFRAAAARASRSTAGSNPRARPRSSSRPSIRSRATSGRPSTRVICARPSPRPRPAPRAPDPRRARPRRRDRRRDWSRA